MSDDDIRQAVRRQAATVALQRFETAKRAAAEAEAECFRAGIPAMYRIGAAQDAIEGAIDALRAEIAG